MTCRRGTSNSNSRGSAADRRARKLWLLEEFSVDLGPGLARCEFDDCDEILDFETITVDRFPIMGCDGGRYVRGNIRPACAMHNSNHGGLVGSERRLAQAS